MTYSVSILLRARQDVQQIFDWLAARSEQGAQSWFESFEISVSALSKSPFLAPIAPENDHCEREIRHVLFRTRQGRFYRALFTVVESEVRILRVRGPGSHRSAVKIWNSRLTPRKRGARDGSFVPAHDHLLAERKGPPTLWYLGNVDGPQCRLQDNTRPRGRKNRPAIGGRRCLGLARQTDLTSLPDSLRCRYSAIGGLIHDDCRKTGCDQCRPGGTSGHRSRPRGGPRSRFHASGCGMHGPDARRNASARRECESGRS